MSEPVCVYCQEHECACPMPSVTTPIGRNTERTVVIDPTKDTSRWTLKGAPYCTRCGYPHEPGRCTR